MVQLTLDDTGVDKPLESERPRLPGIRQLGKIRFWLFTIAIIAQLLTIWITWPLWQVRTYPPHLPVIEIPQISYGVLLLISLAYAWFDPRRGVWLNLAILFVASLSDQMRTQPQFLANWMMMFACTHELGRHVGRWFLATMWFWAGLHKFLSPEWFEMQSWSLLTQAGLPADSLHLAFAIVIAVSEMGIGVLAIVKPKIGAVACPLLHAGIVVFLSPLFINWNFSVIPWNIGSGIVGAWVIWNAKSILPTSKVEWGFAAVFLFAPIGFYFGLMDHGYANVLYSDHVPRGMVTTPDKAYEIEAWGDLRIPFPNERRTLKQHFERIASPGDKLHLYDPRTFLDEQFYRMSRNGQLEEINQTDFFQAQEGEVIGNTMDRPSSVYHLGLGGAEMIRGSENSPILAIKFTPKYFQPELLVHLRGLQNLERVDLGECSVEDEDLRRLGPLAKLKWLGLKDTKVTNAGLRHLERLSQLHTIDYKGTAITTEGLIQMFRNQQQAEKLPKSP